MRDYILLYINGQPHRIGGSDAWLTLSDFLRNRLRMTGTKIVCEEGDCGACSILIADLHHPNPTYYPIDSCIAFVFQLDGFHIVTVEGLNDSESLTSVQQAMLDCHGSQCGFCTPGFVMAMTGVMERQSEIGNTANSSTCNWPLELSGNLCRCTGYQTILDACKQASSNQYRRLEERFPLQPILAMHSPFQGDSICIKHDRKQLFVPRSLKEALQLKRDFPAARWVAGATDVGVQSNKRHASPDLAVSLRRIDELRTIEVSESNMSVGAAVSWTDLLPYCEEHFPPFAQIITIFGSPQIRNMGTIGGNLANASPIADSLPLLHILECELELVSCEGSRWVNINQFYSGYKQFDLRPNELISRIKLPMQNALDRLRLYKISRRRDMDISTFTAAVRMRVQSGIVQTASLAFGAVGPTVLRLPRTETFLTNKPFSIDTMAAAGEIVVQEITPISDVRGSADYRNQVAKNVLLKFYCEESK